MAQRFFEALVARRWLVIVLALAALAGGYFNLRELAVGAVPDISPKQVMILTVAKGLGPLEVERLVTFPIETQMTGLPKMQGIRSTSRAGLSAVYVTFDNSADVQTARAEVFERLKQAEQMMPPGVGTPTEGPFATGLGEIIEFELRGPGYTQMQLYQILEWQVAPQLQLAPGIVGVDIYGGKLPTYEVQASPDRLRARGLSLQDLFSALEANNASRGGAYIESGSEMQIVRGLALAESKEDIASIPIKTAAQGVPVLVGDVADVVMRPKVRLGAVTHDGEGETVVGIVKMQYGLNASNVLGPVKAKMAAVQKKLPPGVEMHIFYDRSDLIQRAISTVDHNLIEGALLVVGVLLLMLGSFRAGLIVAAVIPLSMMFAFAGMRLFGIPANLMSLGAIDFGLVVDGAVVLVENVLRRQAGQEEGARDPLASVPQAAAQVAKPVIFSVVIIAAVYLPVLTLQDIEGKTFRPMAATVMMALCGALLVTMLVIPALAGAFLSKKPKEGDTFVVRWARRGYTPALKRTTAHPWITLLVAAGLFGGALYWSTTLGGEFIPRLQEGAIIVTSNKLPSINLEASLRTATEIERVIKTVPEVKTVVSQTGAAAVPTDPMEIKSTDSYVILQPPDQWPSGMTQQKILTTIRNKVEAAVPGVEFSYSQPIEMRMDDLLQGVRTEVALAISGPDLDELQTLAGQAVSTIEGIKGAGDVRAEKVSGLPALTVQVDREKIARYGLDAMQVLAVVEAVGGRVVGTVYGKDETQTPIVVRLPPDVRTGAARLRQVTVGTSGGRGVPLGEVAEISVADGPSQVKREGLERRVMVEINVRGRDTQSFVAAAQKAVQDTLKLPHGYTLEWSGKFKNLQSASKRLAIVVPGVLALIFLLLYLNFGSLRLAALIFLNVPMAATGGIAALALRGMPLSVTALIGFIATFGVAILDGVVLASYIQEARDEGKNSRDAARESAEQRLRPVLTTALVATIGFIPMALSTSEGSEVQRPLATVVIGGLITATMLTLLVLPSMYPLVAEAKMPSWTQVKGWFGRERQNHPAE